MEEFIASLGKFLPILAGLVVCTNIITEVLKSVTKGTKIQIPAQITATVVAIVLSMVSYFMYISMNSLQVTWYETVASFVLGFFVSYGSQFGYDKLQEVFKKGKS